jgi:PmbA protein
VLFEANVAGSLLGHFVQAASGSSLYRHASFLEGKLGTQVFAPIVRISEDPHLRGEMASAFYDAEGVATDAAARRRQAASSTGGFSRRIPAASSACRPPATPAATTTSSSRPASSTWTGLLRKMGRGFLVTEMMGRA